MAVDVKFAPEFERGPAKELFKVPSRSGGPAAFAFHYDVAADGNRFLVITQPRSDDTDEAPITLTLNWQVAVKR